MELDILKMFSYRENYEAYSRFVKPEAMSLDGWTLLEAMGKWFHISPTAVEVSFPKFSAWLTLVHLAKLPKAKQDVLKTICEQVEVHPYDPTLMKPVLDGLCKRRWGGIIGEAGLKIADGDASLDMEDVLKCVEEYRAEVGYIDELDTRVGGISLDDLEAASSAGLSWRLDVLNDAMGDARKGDFIVLGKRPDSGGTTFVASESTFMATQALMDGKKVLWCNNEEAGNKVKKRIVQAALGWTTGRIEKDLSAAMAEYEKLMGSRDKITVFDKAMMHVRDVERILERDEYGLIIFDQLWKFHGWEKENEVTRMTKLFGWGREIAKAYAPVIAVHQADGTAENTKWINMSQLYMSKTGVQGEADAIITLGRTDEYANVRYIYVPKNKMSGKDPSLRNAKAEVIIQPDIARFKMP